MFILELVIVTKMEKSKIKKKDRKKTCHISWNNPTLCSLSIKCFISYIESKTMAEKVMQLQKMNRIKQREKCVMGEYKGLSKSYSSVKCPCIFDSLDSIPRT